MCAKFAHILLLLATLSAAAALTTFCDTKRALNASATAPLVPALLPSLVSSLHCSGLRVPLLPTLRRPAEYSAAYNATLEWAARAQLAIYASPMEGAWRAVAASEAAYAAWVAAYAAAFRPSHLSVFNEVSDADCDGGCKERVVVAVRRALAPPLPLFVGPDSEHVSASVTAVEGRPNHFAVFDILSSHNAGGDASNTPGVWAKLMALAGGRPVWSSENPACFALPSCTQYGTMGVALGANVSAVVAWNALGDDVTLDGNVTAKGADIAAGWRRRRRRS
jgi:hypothetical protein